MIKVIKQKTIVLVIILLLAGTLRFWQLGLIPASPDWDEVALGYNAYSILKTGKDEYSQQFPVILRSFDDYKPAGYAYLAVPFIKLFGLSTRAVRLPAAILGTLAVLATFYLVMELFNVGDKRNKYRGVSLLSAFLLAISPWHLQFSRAAFESGVGLFLNILIALFFIKGLKKPWWLVLSAFFAGLNIHFYQAEKVFGPLLILLLVMVWRRNLFKLPRRFLVMAVITGLLMVLPFLVTAITTPDIFLRAKGTSFASDITPFLSRTVNKLMRDHQNQDFLGLVLDNRRITYLLAFINGYLSHFDFNWLFIAGDDTRHHAPGFGLLYLIELPFLLLGIYQLIFGRFRKKARWLVFGWMLLAPLPSAFSSGAPHAIRAMRMLPMMQIFIALGLVKFWQWLGNQKKGFSLVLVVFFFSLFIFNFIYYLNQYFVQLNYFTSQAWQYGYQEAVEVVGQIENRYQKVVVSNVQPMDQSYMFFLFYLQYDPATYQAEGGTFSGGYAEENSFGKYIFRDINWSDEDKSRQILYIGRPNDFPDDIPVTKTINYLDSEPAIKVVEGQR